MMRSNTHFISSFQDFVRCDVYDELQRQEQDVHNTVVGRGFAITKIRGQTLTLSHHFKIL